MNYVTVNWNTINMKPLWLLQSLTLPFSTMKFKNKYVIQLILHYREFYLL